MVQLMLINENAVFCQDMLYRLCKQYDHVMMLSKNHLSWQSLDQLVCK